MLCGFIEPLQKHSSYVGFYVPKALECFFNVLFRGYKFHKSNLTSFLLVLTMCGIVGLAHSRGHYNRVADDETSN